jgi:hypothetical protein
MSKIYVKPAAGRVVLLPKSGPGAFPQVPAAGMWVDESVFITRRLLHGDLVTCEPPEGAPAEDQTPQAIAAPGAPPAAARPASASPATTSSSEGA